MRRTYLPDPDHVFPIKVYDHDRRRIGLRHFIGGHLVVGDFIMLQDPDGSPRRYQVLGNVPEPDVVGIWYAELLASPAPVTVMGRTY